MPLLYGYEQHGGPEVQAFFEVEKPDPKAGEVLVANRAAGVDPLDWKIRQGAGRYADAVVGESPMPLGTEVSGVVDALGPEVRTFNVADAVFGTVVGGGGFAEYSVLSTAQMAIKPNSVSFEDAATLPVAAAAAYDGVHQLGLKEGKTLLIVGAGGGVGIGAIQIARGLRLTVIGTESERKKALVESFGAVYVPTGADVLNRIRAVAPRGIDAIFDLVGGSALREVAVLVEDRSKIISAPDGDTARGLGGAPVARTHSSTVLQAVAELVERGTLNPSVSQVFPLKSAGEALVLVETGHPQGKVVIKVAD